MKMELQRFHKFTGSIDRELDIDIERDSYFNEKYNTEIDNSLYLLKPNLNKIPVLGRLNGTIKIPEDFTEPLDEMKRYMY